MLLLMVPAVLADHIVINEVLYNPEATDAGKEFVELYNPSDTTIQLKDYILESGNGANANDWTVEWTGTQSDNVLAHGYFLIGESNVTGSNFMTDLDLQNGPDAVRIRKNQTVIDLVGYGNLQFPEYYESTPAKLAKEGLSLSRTNGIDTDNNSADFGQTEQSPQSGLQESILVQVIVTEPTLEISSVTLTDEDPTIPGFQIIPNPGATKQINLVVDLNNQNSNNTQLKAKFANKLFYLHRLNNSPQTFIGTVNVSYTFPPANYSINITATDTAKSGSRIVDFEFLPLTGLFIDCYAINFSTQANAIFQVIGDLDTRTKDKATIKNIGNVPIDIGLRGSSLSSGKAAIAPENIEFSFGRDFGTDSLTLSTTLQYVNLDLASADLRELSYRVFVPEQTPADVYTGSVFVIARQSE
jgi:hypothetical protein